MSRKTWTVGMLIPLVVAGMGVTTAPAATAAPQDLGACAGREAALRSEIFLAAIPRIRDRISLDLWVQNADRESQTWRVRITHNGAVVVAENAVTRALAVVPDKPSGGVTAGLKVFKVVPNLPGVDRFTARVTNVRTHESCTFQAQVRP